MTSSRLWLGLLGLLVVVHCVQGLVVGIDLGSQWYKLAMVRPGRPIDIVLNEQSSRKTHTMVGWSKEERAFGSDAFNLQARYPAHSYAYLTPFLGKSHDHPLFSLAKEWVTYNVVEDPERNSFLIKHDANTTFTPEELVGMILRHAKELATASFGAPIKDCVITVPPYLTQHERQAVIDAATVGGLNVLSLINDVTAFAMIYARDRFDNETQNVIFFDSGATSTSALLATFQAIPDIKSTKNKTIVQVLVRSVASDQTLGGRFIDRNLANHFKKIIKSKYSSFNVDDVKLTLRLLREAQKMKEVLSANQLAQVSLVGLGDHDDILVTLTRKELEDLNKDIADRCIAPIRAILEEANMTKEDITFVEVVGGNSRVPMIQAALKAFLGKEDLDRHVNGDEGAALGAAFFAAGLSSTFKSSKEIRLRDMTQYPVNVKINLDQAGGSENDVIIDEESDGESKTNTVLLVRGNKLNTRKALTFFSYSNFSLDLSYAQPEALPPGSKMDISHIAVSGMPPATKYNTTGKPKVHASFKLSSNGTVLLDHAEVEITVLEAPKPKVKPVPKVEEKVETKTDETKSDETKKEEETKGEETKPEDTKKEDEAKTEETKQQEANEEKEKEETKNEQEEAENAKEKEGEPTKEPVEEQKGEEAEEPEEGVPELNENGEPALVKRTLKLPLKIVSVETLGVKSLNKDSQIKADMRLSHYDWLDKQRKELQREKNGLESYIYEMRDKLETAEIIEASTEKEREDLSAALASASDWLDENSETAVTAEYKSQSKTLRDKADKIHFRIKERRAFPKAAAEFRKAVDSNRDILNTITDLRNVTEEEKEVALKALDAAVTWFESKQTEQFAVAKNVDPVLTSEEVLRKQHEIEFGTKMLMRKPKKKVEKPKLETIPETEDAEGEAKEQEGETKGEEEGEKEETKKESPKQEEEEEETKETKKETKETKKETKETKKETKKKEEAKKKEEPKKQESKKDKTNSAKDKKKEAKKEDRKKEAERDKKTSSTKGKKTDTKDSKAEKDEL